MDRDETPALKFPEAPRWHAGRFWFSDQLGSHVWTVDPAGGSRAPALEMPRPSGIGFLPDGGMLVASMDQPRVARARDGVVTDWFDLSPFGGHLNDLVVEREGRTYLDAYREMGSEDSCLVLIDQRGNMRVVADGLAFPNGVAVTPDGSRLVVSETFASRITVFDVEADGTLSGRRVWAEVEGMAPDGLCLDAEGNIWVASYLAGEFLHLAPGGQVLDRITVPGRWAMACALGGPDGRTLLLCTAETDTSSYFRGESVGYLDTRQVDVAGVGCP